MFCQQQLSFIQVLLGTWNPENALDVGCGDGLGMLSMQGITSTVWGCDSSHRMLKENPAEKGNLTRCSAYNLPWKDESFDLVYCWELLHHVANPEKVIQEIVRVMRDCIIICEPNARNPAMAFFGIIKRKERGLLRFTPRYPLGILKAIGLNYIKT